MHFNELPVEALSVDGEITLNVIVYTKPNCVQCNATKRALDKAGIEHVMIDVTQDVEVADELREEGVMQMPCVKVVDNAGNVYSSWTGFDPDRIKAIQQ